MIDKRMTTVKMIDKRMTTVIGTTAVGPNAGSANKLTLGLLLSWGIRKTRETGRRKEFITRTMAIKAMMFVMLFATVFCLVESASRWGEIGGYAVGDCDESYSPPPPPPVQRQTPPENPKTKEIRTERIHTKEIHHACCCDKKSSDSSNSHHLKSDFQSSNQKPNPSSGIQNPVSSSGHQKPDPPAGNPDSQSGHQKLDSSTTCACKVGSCSSGNEEQGSSSGHEKSGYGVLNVVLSVCVSVLVTYAVSKLTEQDSVLLVQVEKTGKYIGAGWEKCFDEAYWELRKKVNPFVCANYSRDKELATQNTYLVVSILVAASGIHRLPAINSYSDLDRAAINSYSDLDRVLCYLTSIYSRDIKAVKMLWATRHSIEDFPKLRRLRS
ncbi:hypothetical protein Vadar_019001 [Vaccinium darrowii]|uniref:Uncharacterized protein n=1 Tax=Vaccinium darrowii TaxID=229202 RepID=A0ACB7YGQ3_9ERIC|nr:hypothetical protein Vadar_019001 [Vaccinium darrowii]